MQTAYPPKAENENAIHVIRRRLAALWYSISQFGLTPQYQESDRKNIELANKVNFLLTLNSVGVVIAGLVIGLSVMTLCNILLLSVFAACWLFAYARHLLLARVFGVFMLYNMLMVSMILCGSRSGIEDILITTAMIPVMLLGKKHLKWIVFFIVQCLLYYFIYDTYKLSFDRFAMPLANQLIVHDIMTPVKIITLFITIYLLLRILTDTETEYEARRRVLEEQRNYYFNLLDSMPIHVITYDHDFRYTYVNRDACRDKSVSEWIIGKTDLEYVKYRNLDPAIAQKRMDLMKMAAAEKKAVEKEEEFIDRMGQHHAELRGTVPLFDEDTGEVREYFCYSVDITQRKEAEKKLQETVAALSRVNAELMQFGYVVSHDLKTPLRNISTYLQILRRRVPLDPESDELIDQAVKSVKHMNGMIQDIFMYASTDQANLHREEVDVEELISVICENMASLFTDRNAAVKLNGELPVLFMNRTHALHLFSNLITNALKYNESAEPWVEIGRDNLGFYVRDNGIGIKPQHQAQIFELFKRLHTQEEYEGTGVGLSLCQKIVSLYSGTLMVESEYGTGAIFRFSLPTATIVLQKS